jgi:hypothetical protein
MLDKEAVLRRMCCGLMLSSGATTSSRARRLRLAPMVGCSVHSSTTWPPPIPVRNNARADKEGGTSIHPLRTPNLVAGRQTSRWLTATTPPRPLTLPSYAMKWGWSKPIYILSKTAPLCNSLPFKTYPSSKFTIVLTRCILQRQRLSILRIQERAERLEKPRSLARR